MSEAKSCRIPSPLKETVKLRKKIMKAMQRKAEYGEFKTKNSVQGGWFIWIMDAVEIAEQLMKQEISAYQEILRQHQVERDALLKSYDIKEAVKREKVK